MHRHLCIKGFTSHSTVYCSAIGIRECRPMVPQRQRKGIVQVNTAPPSYPSAISCHNQLGTNQHTSTLSAPRKSSQDSCLHCSSERMAKWISLSVLSASFFLFFSSPKWCFAALFSALCVYSRPLQQPRLLDIASLQLVLSSSRWWSYRVISPTQRLLRWEKWEVCGCQSRACGDDSVRHLE